MFAEMHADVMAVFGQPGLVVRGVNEPVAVTVVVERDVAVTDGYGNLVRRVDMASFLVTEWQPQAGDRLTVRWPGTTEASTKAVQTLDDDDGFIAKAVMHG